MKNMMRIVAVLAALALALPAVADVEMPQPSPSATESVTLGWTEISVSWSRPGVKGRTIWGDLVPWDEMWRTGANKATAITFSKAVTIDGTAVEAGTYALFTIPGKKEWKVILNRNADQWGAGSYDEAENVLERTVTPKAAAATEWLELDVEPTSAAMDRAQVVLRWEKLEVPLLDIELDTRSVALENARKASEELAQDRWVVPYRVATYLFNDGGELEEALEWCQKSVEAQPHWYNTQLHARILDKMGRTRDAKKAAQQAIEVGKADDRDVSVMERFLAGLK